ncbi:MAG: hypothetical protein QXI12_13470 [Candidatus Methanomethyliaceae archaeon]
MTAILANAAVVSLSHSNTAMWSGPGLVAALLLITLLIEKELVRAWGGPHPNALLMKTLDIAIVPLLLTFLFTLVVRLASILNRP